jgi:hypothetical protein
MVHSLQKYDSACKSPAPIADLTFHFMYGYLTLWRDPLLFRIRKLWSQQLSRRILLLLLPTRLFQSATPCPFISLATAKKQSSSLRTLDRRVLSPRGGYKLDLLVAFIHTWWIELQSSADPNHHKFIKKTTIILYMCTELLTIIIPSLQNAIRFHQSPKIMPF